MMLRIPQDLGRLGYGAASLGNLFHELTDAEATAVVDSAWSGGVRYFDTAPHYGLGLSERRLGAALARYPREGYLLSTKVGRLLEPTPANAGSLDDQGFVVPAAYRRVWDPSPAGVHRSLRESMARLGTDRIDIAYLHDPDEYDLAGGIATGMPALAEAKEAGLVRAIGIGSKSVRALAAAVRTGLCDLIMVAGRLTLLDDSGAELTALCEDHGVGIVNVGVFNSGALAAAEPGPQLNFEYAPITPDRLAELTRVHRVCDRFGVRVADAALQYSLRLPAVVNVTVGASTPAQFRRSLEGMSAAIDPALWPELARAARGGATLDLA
ncbi:aldo/keto reductase [Microlunatus ginsengisoli]|uniref:Aldo/keto reductase n=2 Tax=Microlunatus ginsengisoli TaxID=363863 RepID=A0ABP7AJW1_9ACTN